MPADILVTPVNPADLWQEIGFDIDLPAFAKVAIVDGKVVSAWGLAWSQGECWAWFGRFGEFPPNSFVTLLTEIKRTFRAARQLGETEVYTTRDEEYETSERFLKALRFRRDGERNGKEVWVRSLV